jgi:hypothetical protein
MTRPLRSTLFLGTALLAAIIPATTPASAQAAEPEMAYSVGVGPIQNDVITASLDGTVFQRFVDVEPWASIAHGAVAVTRHVNTYRSNVLVYDATTGDRVVKVFDARLPLLTPDGHGLVFAPDNLGSLQPTERDMFVESLWYRDLPTGAEFKLAQFYRADLGILEKAVSPQGDRVAFTRGNNTFLLEWNVWIVNTDGTGLMQLTGDDMSNYPSFRPDGQMLAISKQYEGRCRGALATLGLDGRNEHVFHESTCAMDLQRPIWIGPHRVVAVWWRHDARGNRPVGLVVVNVETGALDPIFEGLVGDVSVSRTLGHVAFRAGAAHGRIGLYDISTGDVRFVSTAEPLARVELQGTAEDAV